MMKQALIVLIALSVSTVGYADVASSSPRSVRLHNYHVWGMGSNRDTPDVLTLRLKMLAKRDSIQFGEGSEWVNDVKGWPGLSAESLKALNPKIRVYRFYTLMAKNKNDSDFQPPFRDRTTRMWFPLSYRTIDSNNWWLRDGDRKIAGEHAADGTNLADALYIDVGKPGFKEAYLQAVLTRNAGKNFDGFVFDYCNSDMANQWTFAGYFWKSKHPLPATYTDPADWLEKAWKPFVKYLVDGLHKAGYRVIFNNNRQAGDASLGDGGQFERSLVDGVVWERGAVGLGEGEWLGGSEIEARINAIATDPLEVWVSDGGLRKSTPDYDRKQRVSLAMYYVGIPDASDKRCYNHKYDGEPSWHALWDFYIGEPGAPATKMTGKYFWSRPFTQGLVLLNYESFASVTFTLDQTYHDSDGKDHSGQVTLRPHSALILATGQNRQGGN